MNFMLENGLYLPGTLSNNFNPGRETIIKAEQAKIKAYGEKINKDSRNKR